jgi:hypothetical protein
MFPHGDALALVVATIHLTSMKAGVVHADSVIRWIPIGIVAMLLPENRVRTAYLTGKRR